MAFSYAIVPVQSLALGGPSVLSEDIWQRLLVGLGQWVGAGFIFSGLDDGSPAGLTQPVNPGTAYINGLEVVVTGAESVTLTDNATNENRFEINRLTAAARPLLLCRAARPL